jgi:hypothetical protein
MVDRFLALLFPFAFASYSFIQSDIKVEAKKEQPPFHCIDSIQVWEDTFKIPFNKIVIIDDQTYTQGKTGAELEKMARQHARKIHADGMYIYKRKKIGVGTETDVWGKEQDLDVEGFDLKNHGIVAENPHYDKRIHPDYEMFLIKVKFFRYKQGL